MTQGAMTDDEMSWLPTDDTPLIDAAIAYASHGFLVIPVWNVFVADDGSSRCGCGNPDCPPKTHGKHPIGQAWQKKATSDVDAVRDARRSRPAANIGLAMGGDRRLVAVDIDGPAGRASWAELEAKHGPAPVTLTSRSGRSDGGEHRIFTVPARLEMKRLGNRASFSKTGIDTRIDNGQVVAAPSLHRTGSRYTWTTRAPVAEMPEWLFDALAAPKSMTRSSKAEPAAPAPRVASISNAYFAKALANACEAIASMAEGGRNQMLFAKACTIFEYCVGEGIDHIEAWRALAGAAARSGLGTPEIEATLNKSWKQAQNAPRRVPPPQLRSLPGGNQPAPSSPGAPPPSDGWERHLDVNAEGHVKKTLGNVTTILSLHPDWRGVIVYDAFAEGVVTTRPQPMRVQDAPERPEAGEWQEENSILAANWLSEHYSMDVATSVVDQAVMVVAKRKIVHPVCDYLRALSWDGVPRLDRMLSTHFGATDNEYSRGVGSRWMISAVARVFKPGCQADCTLVLESPRLQGVGKSTGLEFLAGVGTGWFADTGIHVGDKDSYQSLRRKWIYELAELSSVKGRDVERVKGFLSARTDNYRASFGRRNRDFPRQVIFAGTTNDSEYLVDRTGNRRWWPVRVGTIDRDAIVRDRDQLWAEARVRFEAGEPWHVNTPHFRALCEAEQALRVQDDPWEEIVLEWLESARTTRYDPADGLRKVINIDPVFGITGADVLLGALQMRPADITRAHEMRVAEVLRAIGWERTAEKVSGPDGRHRRYRRSAKVGQVGHVGWAGIDVSNQTDTHNDLPAQPKTEISNAEPKNGEPSPAVGRRRNPFEDGQVGQTPQVRGNPNESPPNPNLAAQPGVGPGCFDDLLDDEGEKQ